MTTAQLLASIALVTVPGVALADHGDRERTEFRYHARAVQHLTALGEPERYESSEVRRSLPDAEPATTLSTGALAIAPQARKPAFLSAKDIEAELAPWRGDMQRCYTQRASETGGELAVTLVIGRDGGVISSRAAAPQLARKTAARVERCIEAIVGQVEFPARRNDTTVVVPFAFHKTEGAGPVASCWSARGC